MRDVKSTSVPSANTYQRTCAYFSTSMICAQNLLTSRLNISEPLRKYLLDAQLQVCLSAYDAVLLIGLVMRNACQNTLQGKRCECGDPLSTTYMSRQILQHTCSQECAAESLLLTRH